MDSTEKKTMFKKLTIAVGIMVTVPTFALRAQTNPYVGSASIGEAQKPASELTAQGLKFRPLSEWKGERFIFLPTTKTLQSYGYQSVHKSGETFGGLGYTDHVGRIAKVTGFQQSDLGDTVVQFKFEDNGEEVEATASSGSVEGIGPVADIDSARSRWLGKTLWYTGNELVTYDANANKFGSTPIKKFYPVRVTNIVAGSENNTPVRFIIQDSSGNIGFIDINLTGTNVSEILRDGFRFESQFLEADPRITHPWDAKTWEAIEDGKVFVGMSKPQVTMSWGKPKNINTSSSGLEQWVYSDQYLYFTDETLSSFQSSN